MTSPTSQISQSLVTHVNPLADLTGYRDLYLLSLSERSFAKMIKDNAKYGELKTIASDLDRI